MSLSQILKFHFSRISRNTRVSPIHQRASPPRLPPADQKIFDDLVRAAELPADPSTYAKNDSSLIEEDFAMHPDARKPLQPEFEGDINPITGEQGGPKREPLKFGDWSYAGRTSDF